MISLVWETCNTTLSYSQCQSNMALFASQLQSDCSQELGNQNPSSTSISGYARRGLSSRSYSQCVLLPKCCSKHKSILTYVSWSNFLYIYTFSPPSHTSNSSDLHCYNFFIFWPFVFLLPDHTPFFYYFLILTQTLFRADIHQRSPTTHSK